MSGMTDGLGLSLVPFNANIVNVTSFGAKGDGVTNDSAAIANAIAEAATLNYGTVYFPYGVYYTGTTTTTVVPNVAIFAENGAVIRYDGVGVALLIQSDLTLGGSNMFYGRRYVLPAIFKGTNATPAWFNAGDVTSVGVHITSGMQNCEVWFPGVLFFNTAILLDSSTAASNIVCNNFYLGRIINCKNGIHLVPQALWGVNQNQFMGGSIRVDAGYTTADPSWKLWLDGVETNNNTFIGVNLELGSPTQKAISCASDANEFIGCRFEGGQTTAGFITFLAGADNNHIRGGWGSFNTFTGPYDAFVSDAGAGNVYEYASVTAGKFMNFNWQSGRIQFGNGTVVPDVPIRGYATDRLQFGDANTLGIRYFGGQWQEETIQTTGAVLVGYANNYQLTYAGPTTITGAGGAMVDQTISSLVTIISTNGNITLQHDAAPAAGSGHFFNKAGVNLLLTANLPVAYVQMNGVLYQL
jgi:hypothetical protein